MVNLKTTSFCLLEQCQPTQAVLCLLTLQNFGSPSVVTANAAKDSNTAANAVLEESTLALPRLAWMMFLNSR
jgi:hypothetical protein